MNISRYLPKNCIKIGLAAEDKESVILELVGFAAFATGMVRNERKLLQAVMERERKASTGIGMGIAIPHGRTFAVRDFLMVLCIENRGRDFEALDNQPAQLFFLMSAPPDNDTKYLRVIRELGESLRDEELREKLKQAETVDEAYFLLKGTG
ncbi:MAG: PTS sugar transporter subunit IIA [Candidatus Wallbacteria bacterium]|nr:PTS sugar transporter subunit IIA [Candidatus Wallbacteria bacterium]